MNLIDKIFKKVEVLDEQYEDASSKLRQDDFDIRKMSKKDLKNIPKIGYMLIGLMFLSSLVLIILGFAFGI